MNMVEGLLAHSSIVRSQSSGVDSENKGRNNGSASDSVIFEIC